MKTKAKTCFLTAEVAENAEKRSFTNSILAVLEKGNPTSDKERSTATAQANAGEQGSSLAGKVVGGLLFYSLLSLGAWYAYITPRFGWLLFILLAPLWWGVSYIIFPDPGAIVVLIIYLVGFGFAKYRFGKTARYRRARGDRKRTSFLESLREAVRPRTRTSISSDSSSDSDSSDSGYSGGGGSSGGGGASSNW